MLGDSVTINAIAAALSKLLRPLVRLLLKHSFSYSAFETIAKRVFVEVAMEDLALPNRKPSVSRAAILTGLNRKEVTNLLCQPWSESDVEGTRYNRAARVVTGWVREPKYQDESGAPRILAMDGDNSFAELVRAHGADVPTRAVLDELIRVGAAQVLDDGRVQLVQRAFVPNKNTVSTLNILGTDASELIETIVFNLEAVDAPKRYQRKVMHHGIPIEALPDFRALSARQSQQLLELFDGWLSEHDLGDDQDKWPDRTARVSVGIYYNEEIGDHRKVAL